MGETVPSCIAWGGTHTMPYVYKRAAVLLSSRKHSVRLDRLLRTAWGCPHLFVAPQHQVQRMFACSASNKPRSQEPGTVLRDAANSASSAEWGEEAGKSSGLPLVYGRIICFLARGCVPHALLVHAFFLSVARLSRGRHNSLGFTRFSAFA